MNTIKTLYYYGQDGEVVSDEIRSTFKLGTQEMEYSDRLKRDVFNVVGFVFQNEKILVVFPKHYMKHDRLNELNHSHEESVEDIKLLYDVIKKYCEKENTTASARSYMGFLDDKKYESDYPFAAFYEIYEYYQKYGLYREKETLVKKNEKGKISWKDTMQKSQKIISGGNLIFAPIYASKKNYKHVFITECMAFVIDHTIEYFSDFLSMKKTDMQKSKFDYLGNIDYVINRLIASKNEVFKDINKKLVQSLIDFFVQYKDVSRGGKIHIKIRHFNMIWQKMIGYYLNRHFVGISADGNAVLFDDSIVISNVTFEDKTFDDIDDSSNHFYIDVDHFAMSNDKIYIFDSKYYSSIGELNYKQFAYNEILRYYNPNVTEINNVLLLPGKHESGVHFSLSSKYIGPRSIGGKIIEQYLEPVDVMKDYISY